MLLLCYFLPCLFRICVCFVWSICGFTNCALTVFLVLCVYYVPANFPPIYICKHIYILNMFLITVFCCCYVYMFLLGSYQVLSMFLPICLTMFLLCVLAIY